MVIIMKPNASEQSINSLANEIKNSGLDVHISKGAECTIIGLVGNTALMDREQLALRPGVERVMRVAEPYKKAGRKFQPDDTVISVGDAKIGGKKLAIIAGPCSVESEEQISEIAREVKKSGAGFLRGGAYKPRTSPYAFQGLEKDGIQLLAQARKETGLPIVTEIMSPKLVEYFDEYVDIIQIGARNMQNFDLLKELGKTKRPIILKRGLSSTIEEWLMSAEYILAGGNNKVILCERGIRTFETYTRNTLDISAVMAVKKLSHLPVIVDPSHAAGMNWMVPALSMAAIAAGADGLIIEVHNDPANALCDGPQSLTPSEFDSLVGKLSDIARSVGREI